VAIPANVFCQNHKASRRKAAFPSSSQATMEVSYMQRHAQLSRFDNDARITKQLVDRVPVTCPEPVPLKHTQVHSNITRDHPDADWAGRVPQPNCKKVYNSHSAQKTSIIATENGILPNNEAKLSEHNFNTRKHFKDDLRFSGLNQETPHSNAYQAGPGEEHSASQWKTSYQTDIENRNGTQTDQYLAGKGPNRRGKKIITPAYEMAGRQNARGTQQMAMSNQPSISSGGMRGGGNRSMLAGLGSSILSDVSR